MRRLLDLALVAGFLVIIGLPLSANLAGRDGGDQEAENRDLARFPRFEWSWDAVKAWPTGLDSWFQDHFGFRSTLVRWYGQSRYYGLHVSPSSNVVRGKAGWLYYAADGGLDDYTNANPLPPGEIENWRQTVLRARDWCRAHGVAYVFTIAPDKAMIYPEYYDDHVRQLSTVSRADQLFTATLNNAFPRQLQLSLCAAQQLVVARISYQQTTVFGSGAIQLRQDRVVQHHESFTGSRRYINHINIWNTTHE